MDFDNQSLRVIEALIFWVRWITTQVFLAFFLIHNSVAGTIKILGYKYTSRLPYFDIRSINPAYFSSMSFNYVIMTSQKLISLISHLYFYLIVPKNDDT